MLWFLRRTRLSSAASLLNVLNNNSNNNSSSSSSSAQPNDRPTRKEYTKLSGVEEATSSSNKLDNDQNPQDSHRARTRCTDNCPLADLLETDTDSSITDLEFEERDDYSDDSDFDETLTCNVCDRSFPCPRQLSSHKQKKRHFGCSACDSLFPSLMALEHHKEEFEHWSGDEDICTESEDEEDETVAGEEHIRLL